MNPRKYVWPELPRLMGISASTKFKDRKKKDGVRICYMAIRVRTQGKYNQTVKEFPINRDTYFIQMMRACAWLQHHDIPVLEFEIPNWEVVVHRMNVHEEIITTNRYVYYDKRELA